MKTLTSRTAAAACILLALAITPITRAQSVIMQRMNRYNQTDASVLTPYFKPFSFEVSLRGGNVDMTNWGPAFYKAGSGGVPATGASSATNTGTLNFSATPNNGTDYMFMHDFATDSDLLATYPVAPTESGNYGVKFTGSNAPLPPSFTAGLTFSGGDFSSVVPQVTSADNGAVWSSGLVIRAAGLTTVTFNSFPEYTTSTYGALIGAGVYDQGGNVVPSATANSYYVPALSINQAAITQLTIDGSQLTPGIDYTLELQYGVLGSVPSQAALNSVSFQGLVGYYKTTTVRITANPQQPAITNQPASTSVTRGGSISLTVSATGGALSYQWRKGGVNLTNSASISGATTATLAISNTQITDAGSYDVVVTNSVGTATSNAAVLAVMSDNTDFNADGKPDLVWQNTATGQRAIWTMNGTTPVASFPIATIPTDWDLAGSADFNGDGKPDLIWQNKSTGERAIWTMNGTTPVASYPLITIPIEWDLVGAADFNGDGKPDLIWQNTTTGERAIWTMNGTTPVASYPIATIPVDWDLVGAADFNGDGKPDLIWQNKSTGERAIWTMNGTTPIGSVPLITIPTDWDLVGAADFNGDGKPDLVWQNTTTGERAIWTMNGTTPTGSAPLITNSTDWDLVR